MIYWRYFWKGNGGGNRLDARRQLWQEPLPSHAITTPSFPNLTNSASSAHSGLRGPPARSAKGSRAHGIGAPRPAHRRRRGVPGKIRAPLRAPLCRCWRAQAFSQANWRWGVGCGIGRSVARLASMHAAIQSCNSVSASARVSPTAELPGKSGAIATQQPLGSCQNTSAG